MSLINKIYKAMSDESRVLEVVLYGDKSMAFYVWETRVPIEVDVERGEAMFCSECTDYRLTADMLFELSEIINLIEENMDEVRSWVELGDEGEA